MFSPGNVTLSFQFFALLDRLPRIIFEYTIFFKTNVFYGISASKQKLVKLLVSRENMDPFNSWSFLFWYFYNYFPTKWHGFYTPGWSHYLGLKSRYDRTIFQSSFFRYEFYNELTPITPNFFVQIHIHEIYIFWRHV